MLSMDLGMLVSYVTSFFINLFVVVSGMKFLLE